MSSMSSSARSRKASHQSEPRKPNHGSFMEASEAVRASLANIARSQIARKPWVRRQPTYTPDPLPRPFTQEITGSNPVGGTRRSRLVARILGGGSAPAIAVAAPAESVLEAVMGATVTCGALPMSGLGAARARLASCCSRRPGKPAGRGACPDSRRSWERRTSWAPGVGSDPGRSDRRRGGRGTGARLRVSTEDRLALRPRVDRQDGPPQSSSVACRKTRVRTD
jgi:hypothetical protein